MKEHLTHIFGHSIDGLLVLIAGACAGVGERYKEAKNNGVIFGIKDAFVSLIIHLVGGLIFGIGAVVAEQPEISVILSTIIGAWLGAEGIKRIALNMLTGKK